MEYGLIGEKLGHSFSKIIHEQLESYTYRLCPLEKDQVGAFLERRAFRGINVTIPYKKTVIPYCSWVQPQAAEIGAVNTVVNRSGLLYGYNTDADGFAYLLRANGIDVEGRTVLVLGSGGTHNTVCAVCRQLGAKAILTVSRSAGKEVLSYEEAARCTQAQVVVNTSPAGMFPDNGGCLLDLSALNRLEAVVDVVYNPFRTELMLRAEERGVRAVCGLEMLVAQAVYAAGLFLNVRPRVERIPEIGSRLRAQLGNVSIIGMPGSGKTSISLRLAKCLDKQYVDLDEEIVRRSGRSIPEIFAQEGEGAFRAMEAQVLAEWSAKNGCVISCGGGVIKTPGNVRRLRQNGVVLFLDRPVELLATEGRPLSTGLERLHAMERERRPLYLAAADAVVPNDETMDRAVQRAAEAVRRLYAAATEKTTGEEGLSI